MDWFYERSDEECGPASDEQIKELVMNGSIRRDTSASRIVAGKPAVD
jgi:hypothetical protein